MVLLDRRSPEAVKFLRLAQQNFRKAHLALAIFHLRDGYLDATDQDLHNYLGPEWNIKAPAFEIWVAHAAQMNQPSRLFSLSETRK